MYWECAQYDLKINQKGVYNSNSDQKECYWAYICPSCAKKYNHPRDQCNTHIDDFYTIIEEKNIKQIIQITKNYFVKK